MKKILCIALAALFCVSNLCIPTRAQASAKLDGETSRQVKELYPGVELTKYTLDSSSKYNTQVFSTVEFDPAQDDLYFDVTGGGKWVNKLATPSATIQSHNQNGEGKTALAAVNGDMWTVTYAHARVEGSGTTYGGCSDAVVTKGLSVPRGFTMYNGEIICTQHMVQETPYEGSFNSFGISASGEALLGEIVCDIAVTNVTKDKVYTADGINRLPANHAFVMYTDKGVASNYALSDAYEVVIDCGYDYTVRHGETITGTVTAVTKTGDEKYPMQENRIILTARGNKRYYASRFKAGDEVMISVQVNDNYGNTAKWRTVSECVGCHIPVIVNGNINPVADNTRYPTSILGIKADGKVVMLTGYGRQGSTGYSYGFKISQMGELCAELGIETAILLDGGGSAAMVVASDAGYELTGRPCDKFSDGSYGKERTVVNSVILSYGEPRKGGEALPITFPNADSLSAVKDWAGVFMKNPSCTLTLMAAGSVTPYVEFSYDGADSSLYKYLTVTARVPKELTLGVYAEVGSSPNFTEQVYKSITLDKAGEWHTYAIRFGGSEGWGKRLFSLRLVLFDGEEAVPGEAINISSLRFFGSKSEADSYAENVASLGEYLRGDANSDGELNIRDAMDILRIVTDWDVPVNKVSADYNCDEKIGVADAMAIVRLIANG